MWPGADEQSPSRSQYFSWINNTNEGPTEAQTRANLAFFAWLRDEYGMQLDIYAFDAGAIDGASFYGSMDSERFQRQFPNGFGPVARLAAESGTRLGIWGGPDGFGDTVEDAAKRTEMMVSLCRDHQFELFKFDAVCGQLRPEKQDDFAGMMTECRRHSPDLILLNHRLDLGTALPHATTFLLGGAETYIDVHMANGFTATHSRAVALARESVPGLKRLTEDHGVCLSSCLDHWDDDLILQAFSRCLILAPEIYGNPWLLRDDEYPRLARIFNLHRRYRDVMVSGIELPEAEFGAGAVSRGDGGTRLITLRNLGWETVRCSIPLDTEIGIAATDSPVYVRRLHPFERVLGEFGYGEEVTVEAEPFRSLLLLVTSNPDDLTRAEPAVTGVDFEVVKPGQLILRGDPGSTAEVTFPTGMTQAVEFPGTALRLPIHRLIGTLMEVAVPEDARALYEATCFAADNNALEYRELVRSGPTEIAPVQGARDAFFNQPTWRRRFLADANLFDDDPETAFAVGRRWGEMRVKGGAFRLDLGDVTAIDRLELEVGDDYHLQPLKSNEGAWGAYSDDLKTWHRIRWWCSETISAEFPAGARARYITLDTGPDFVRAVRGYLGGTALDRTRWRASNLFASAGMAPAVRAWSYEFRLDEAATGAYVCVAIEGTHGIEGAYAALRVGDGYAGAPRRAPSFPSNTWECPVRKVDRNYTYFIPVTEAMIGVPLAAVVLQMGSRAYPWSAVDRTDVELHPKVWITANPIDALASIPMYLDA